MKFIVGLRELWRVAYSDQSLRSQTFSM
jgi:hypothetical protein